MSETLLLEAPVVRQKPLWRRWKWIGLALFLAALLFQQWLPDGIRILCYLVGTIVIFNLLFLLFRRLRNRAFWRVRHRLLGAFVFVGLIPILLVAGILYIGGEILAGQLASNYVRSAISDFHHQVSWINVEIGGELKSPDQFEPLAVASFRRHASQFPHLYGRLARRVSGGRFQTLLRYDPSGFGRALEPYNAELWIGQDGVFEGFLRKGRGLYTTSLHPVPGAVDLYLDVTAPIDEELAQRLISEKSIYLTNLGAGNTTIRSHGGTVNINVEAQGEKPRVVEKETELAGILERRKSDPRPMVSWGAFLEGRDFETGKPETGGILLIQVPYEVLYRTYLAGNEDLGRVLLIVMGILCGMFVMAEIVSLVIGISISRKITQSVHDMYQGLLALKKGDLQHRIPVRRNDQLGLLAHSFNQMTGSITRLLEEVSEKKRLEQELEIAREVQATLFPKHLPRPRGLAVFGGCEPARVVSGDYYDFILESDSHLHIIVGDISGKGISAALLMANLQAAIRNQLMAFKQDGSAQMDTTLACVMSELNHQVYLNSPSEKYATLFASLYDAETRRLFYCNAGHLAPILLDNGHVERLDAGGTVLGLFPTAEYSSQCVELRPGALLAIFTDGITEAVNDRDEEFGEERLIQSLREERWQVPEAIYQSVIARVKDWQGNLKQHDDITLIVAKSD
jgi:sigma-B regulation protein RsbU (phosphoserine phosphatase)